MFKKIDTETKVGGICAIIAIVAGIFEMAFNGFTSDVIAGGIKDIFGTLVAVLVLVVAVRKLRPKKETPTFEQVLENEISLVQKRYDPLFFKSEKPGYPNIIRYNLRTNISCLFSDNNDSKGRAGVFVDFDKSDRKKAIFNVNKSTFGENLSENDWKIKAPSIAEEFVACIGRKFQGFCEAKKNKSGEEITVTFHGNGLSSPDDAIMFARLIEYLIILYAAKYEKE